MRVAIVGNGQLAACLNEVLKPHHQLVPILAAEVIWAAQDTAVLPDGTANSDAIATELAAHFGCFKSGSLVVLSSQVPPGFTQKLRHRFRQAHPVPEVEFCYLLENIKANSGAAGWSAQRAFVVGTFGGVWVESRMRLLLKPFPQPVLFMRTASAELAKTAINGFLATNIAYANELADVAALCGASPSEIELAMRSDARIGVAPVTPGRPFANEHLGRDLRYLLALGGEDVLPVVSTVYSSNLKRLRRGTS